MSNQFMNEPCWRFFKTMKIRHVAQSVALANESTLRDHVVPRWITVLLTLQVGFTTCFFVLARWVVINCCLPSSCVLLLMRCTVCYCSLKFCFSRLLVRGQSSILSCGCPPTFLSASSLLAQSVSPSSPQDYGCRCTLELMLQSSTPQSQVFNPKAGVASHIGNKERSRLRLRQFGRKHKPYLFCANSIAYV